MKGRRVLALGGDVFRWSCWCSIFAATASLSHRALWRSVRARCHRQTSGTRHRTARYAEPIQRDIRHKRYGKCDCSGQLFSVRHGERGLYGHERGDLVDDREGNSGHHLGAAGGDHLRTALSATQLNATANVPGTFAYAPAAGTVLNAGTQTLSVTFTPTDGSDYNSATATVSLVVNPRAASFTVTPVSFTYDGLAQGPTITPSPAGPTFGTTGTTSATAAGSSTK